MRNVMLIGTIVLFYPEPWVLDEWDVNRSVSKVSELLVRRGVARITLESRCAVKCSLTRLVGNKFYRDRNRYRNRFQNPHSHVTNRKAVNLMFSVP